MTTTAITPQQIQHPIDMANLLSLYDECLVRGDRTRGPVGSEVRLAADGEAVRARTERHGRVGAACLLGTRLTRLLFATRLVAAVVVAEEAATCGGGRERAPDQGDFGHADELVHVCSFPLGPGPVPGDAG